MSAGIRNNKFDKFGRDLEAEQKKRLSRAAIIVSRRAKERLSVSGTGVRSAMGGIVRAVKRTKKTIYGAFPSRPGESPHKQTGRLRASVTQEITGAVARVGTNVKYGRWLEQGTRKMARRPWLEVSLRESMSQIRQIFNTPWKWNG